MVLFRHSLDTILLKLPVEANERVEKLKVRGSITMTGVGSGLVFC